MKPLHAPPKFYQKRNARVELLPLIDVMFLLVAFFMIVSISMVSQKGIFVNLAPAHTTDSDLRESALLVISVDDTGTFFLQKNPVSPEELQTKLAAKAAHDPDTPLVINADKGARHGDVVRVLDIVRQVSMSNVVFSVEPRE